MFKLRDYQGEAIDAINEALAANPQGRYIVQLPTGMGKTVIFSSLLRDLGKRALVIAHREELLSQAKNKIAACGIPASLIDIVLQSRPNPEAQIWVASIQTLVRGNRLAQIAPEIIIIDECHHSAAASYRTVLDYSPDVPAIGFSATPTRSKGREKKILSEIWQDIIYSYPIKKAILDEHLANIEYYQVQSGVDLAGVRTTAGDFNQGDLAEKIDIAVRNTACLEKYLELGGGKCVIFCVNVAHAESMRDTFVNANIEASTVTGETPHDERAQILAEFDAAPMDKSIVLTNCMVLTEGWDCPDVRMLILARPTQSAIVYLQQLGRGLRRAPGKDAVIVIDVADNCRNKRICRCLSTVFNLRYKEQEPQEGDVLKLLTGGGGEGKEKTVLASVELALAKILFDMPLELERSKIAWYSPQEKEYFCSVDKEKYLLILDDALDYKLYGVKGTERKLLATSTNIGEIDGKARDMAEKYWPHTRYMWDKSRRKDWSSEAPTEKQIKLLAKIAPEINPYQVSKATASEIISAKFSKSDGEPATSKQKYFLCTRGVEVNGMSRREASREIAKIKAGEEA